MQNGTSFTSDSDCSTAACPCILWFTHSPRQGWISHANLVHRLDKVDL